VRWGNGCRVWDLLQQPQYQWGTIAGGFFKPPAVFFEGGFGLGRPHFEGNPPKLLLPGFGAISPISANILWANV
jgi:hypothetical protein